LTSDYTFHIRNANPNDMVAVLLILEEHPGLNTISEIVDCADTIGLSIRDRQRLEALTTARDLRLIEQYRNELTELGQLIVKIELYKPEIFADIIHGLYYYCWKPQTPNLNCFSWSYRTLCQMLWSAGSFEIDNRRDLASKIETQARQTFGHSDITFSSKSIGGALLWLKALEPKIIDEVSDRFTRRDFCPPELFVMSLDFVYMEETADYSANILLNDTTKDLICQMCMLEPRSFDRILEYAIVQFDFLESGIGGGWGQYITLHRQPTLRDFV
jgi:hypothetical protein